MSGLSLTWKRTADTIVPVGVDVASGAPLAARAAALSRILPPGTVVARRTAAWVWGLDVLPPGADEADWTIDLIAPTQTTPITAETVELAPSHITTESGTRLTTPPRTALDCARWLPRYDAVAALDQFLRRGVDTGELITMARTLPGYRGNKRLRETLRLADRGAASPAESWTRVGLMTAGFPRPRTQVPVMGPTGHLLYIDLGYPDHRVGLEYDGERHHTGPKARAHDKARRTWLTKQMGWDILPVTKEFLYNPAPYLEALLTALLHRGWNPEDATMNRIATHLTRLTRRPY
jgi:very-short-patch-repair endonuclease